jgi:hypothetical protein
MTKAIVPVNDNVISRETADWYYEEKAAADRCATAAFANILEWWIHQYTIASNKLWQVEFTSQEDWIEDLLFRSENGIVIGSHGINRSTFYTKLTALSKLLLKGIALEKAVQAMVNAPGATLRIAALPPGSESEGLDPKVLIESACALNFREANTFVLEQMHKTKYWISQVRYNETRWVLEFAYMKQDWEKDDKGEWAFAAPDRTWMEIKPIPPDLIRHFTAWFLHYGGPIEVIK